MATYLTTGIVQNIIVDKKEAIGRNIALDVIIDKLKEEINIDYYHYSEDEDSYYWRIIPKVLEGNLAGFLETQFQMYDHNKSQDQDMKEALRQIKETTTGDQLIALAESKNLVHFQLVKHIFEYMRLLNRDGFDFPIMTRYHLISFFMDGKILMECYDNILNYFSNTIRLQRAQYPVADCIKVCITS